MRIVVANQKGGVGKTSVVLLLAAVLKKAGWDVAIDDRDPQGTARFFAKNVGATLIEDEPDATFIITDTPGHLKIEGPVGRELASLVSKSDKIIVVSEKSPAAIHGTVPMINLVKEKKGKDAKAYLLFNKVRSNTVIGQQDPREIAHDLGLPCLENELSLSAAYENAFTQGLAAVTGKQREDLLNLALEIMK